MTSRAQPPAAHPSQGVTAASSGKRTHAGAETRRLAWRCLARPSAGHRSYRRGAAEIPAGISAAGTAAPTTTVMGNTVPQRANLTQTGYGF